ncbi:MAG: AAA domain-containing protein [Candidatus Zixiibacteriota bacterium]
MDNLDSTFTDNRKPLPPLLDEFRAALQDEIQVAKRHASNSAIPLSNGHKVGQQAGAHQYAFLIDTILNTPDGAPGDLIVPGKPPIEVTVVSVEGLRIVISVENDLGKFVPTARLQTNLTILMRKLIDRIEDNASANNSAAARMLGSAPARGSPKKPPDVPKLNQSQMRALESALGRNLTVIWGPPGTGKTYTIGAIARYLHSSVRTVLIVSHTNIAVDQAITQVARAMPDKLEQGAVIRVGEVRDEVLKNDYADVLLERQVERQSRELVRRRETLSSEMQTLNTELTRVQKEISIIDWIETAQSDIQQSASALEDLQEREHQLRLEETTLSELKRQYPLLVELRDRVSQIFALRKEITSKMDQQTRLNEESPRINAELTQIQHRLRDQQSRVETAERIAPLREERARYPTPTEQRSTIETVSQRMVEAEQRLADMQHRYAAADGVLTQARNTGALMRVLKRLPKPHEQQIIVSDLRTAVATLEAELSASQTAYERAGARLVRILELDGELSRHEAIGTYSQELDLQTSTRDILRNIEEQRAGIESAIRSVRSEIEQLESEERHKAASLTGNPDDVYSNVCEQLRQLKDLQESVESAHYRISEVRKATSSLLSRLLAQLREWDAVEDEPSQLNERLDLAREAHQRLAAEYKVSDLPTLNDRTRSLRSEIQQVTRELENIDERLAQVERDVISNASVVGATLTKTYLSDDIQARRFDTVILDEASMAPIPALWAAALLSEKNLVVVGDFKQLPPIVLSKKELTKNWLGRDIFEVSGLKALWEKGSPPDHFIPLDEQRRMLPEIAEVANLFYDGSLRSQHEPIKGYDEFPYWYRTDWPHDNPVVLVDTGSLNAWVTSVVKGGNSSRLNFLSATVAVDLAEQLLNPGRHIRAEGAPKRILIVAPYRAHAKLVSVLLKQNPEIQDDVISGTAHSFQGSEADAVIFDLVADEPHFRVNLFIPSLDDQIRPILNVGLTRAKFRLFILGDFSYCRTQGKNAFLGKTLLPFLLDFFPRIEASQVIPDGLAARAARAQMTMLGGQIEPDSGRIVVTQADFFRILSSDLSRSSNRIIIYSPFITQDRLAFLMPQLQAAAMRGVSIFLITKSHSERSKAELPQVRQMEARLSAMGAVVVHKMRMHEKLVFVDDDITWSGSLNPLSFSNTQEVMERRKSSAVLADYFQTLRLHELLSVPGTPLSACPICASEIVAAEGAAQPYYWRCVRNNCYTRGIDQPYPFDGVLKCAACNSPVEFGYWGHRPHWRCKANNRHRQRIFRSHLRLPKMLALIPKHEIREVCKLFGIDDLAAHVIGP